MNVANHALSHRCTDISEGSVNDLDESNSDDEEERN